MKGIRTTMVAGTIAALFTIGATAEAVELRARCDYKAPKASGKGERTRVRVDGMTRFFGIAWWTAMIVLSPVQCAGTT